MYRGLPHLDTAAKYIGLTETNNRGPFFDKINRRYAYLAAPYCAAFVSYCLDQGVVALPTVRSASSRAFVIKGSYTANDVLQGRKQPKKGDLVIWIRKGGGHIGFITEDYTKNSFKTLEANTSSGAKGSQHDGGGIYRRTRSIEPMNFFRITHFTSVKYK